MKQNKSTQPDSEIREINLGGIKITEFLTANPPHTTISLKLNSRTKTFATGKPLERYRAILTDQIKADISILFRLIEFLGVLGYSDDYDGAELGEYQSVLGSTGKMFAEALEDIDFSFERHEYLQSKQAEATAPQIENETAMAEIDKSAIAKHISALLNNPHTPVELHNVLADCVSELQNDFPEDWKSVEVIEKLLKSKAAGGEK